MNLEVIGPSATQLFRNLSFALTFPPGSELVISKLDHEANIAAWVDLAKRQNLIIKWWAPPSSNDPKLTPENLKPLLSEKTKLVTLTHASNILGTIHDVKAISKMVHTIPGAMICVDSVAFAPHRQIDVRDWDVDFYCFSWYKVSISVIIRSLTVEDNSLIPMPGLWSTLLTSLCFNTSPKKCRQPWPLLQSIQYIVRQADSRFISL